MQDDWLPPAEALAAFPVRQWVVAWAKHPLLRTWRLDGPAGEPGLYVKAGRGRAHAEVIAERARLEWAAGRLAVPEVVAGGESDAIAWHATRAMPGSPGVAPENLERPAELAAAMGRGLRRFHAAAIEVCPFDFRNARALEIARSNVSAARFLQSDLLPEHQGMDLAEALATMEALVPCREEVVLTHGDYCVPNVLLEDGEVTGFVDIGGLGLADRWRDLAVGTWSVTRNLGPGFEGVFLEGYGVEADPRRQKFCRLLYDLAAPF